MKAWELQDRGFDNLRLVERPTPQPGPHDLLVRVFIRQQLPIGKEYEGLPWCSQEYNGKLGFTPVGLGRRRHLVGGGYRADRYRLHDPRA